MTNLLTSATRQVGILLRAVSNYRKGQNLENCACIIAGGRYTPSTKTPLIDSPDFNLTPEDAAYSLMVGETVTDEQEKSFNDSRVVHVSVDHTIQKNSELKPHEEVKEEKDSDRVITNSRACQEADGLLTLEELASLYR